jgi:cellulose synthase/poly-beta-1,6-N-acetylglucosamine synthase-like glycosyltransferase
MILVTIAGVLFVCAGVPAALFVLNLRRYLAPQTSVKRSLRIAVLIPARDEERNIGACVESVLASRDVELEVLVLDDASTDCTAEIVQAFALRDARVRLVGTQSLPAGSSARAGCWRRRQLRLCCCFSTQT